MNTEPIISRELPQSLNQAVWVAENEGFDTRLDCVNELAESQRAAIRRFCDAVVENANLIYRTSHVLHGASIENSFERLRAELTTEPTNEGR